MYRSPLLAVLAAAGLAVAACSASPSSHGAAKARFAVTSTLDGLTALPHRIHWQAFPRPSANVSEVDFLIDGKQLWVEHVSPYFYGGDSNYLVTSFLAPGAHAFTVRAADASGHVTTDTVTATVPAAPRPPTALAGTWKGFALKNKNASPGSCTSLSGVPVPCPPAGYARLVISPVGWAALGTYGGALYDVAYLSPGLAEIRTGMYTGHPNTDGNAWCNNEPGSPVRVRWTVRGNLLWFTPVGSQKASCGFTAFLQFRFHRRAVPWTKARP
jgi:hypothetical protein